MDMDTFKSMVTGPPAGAAKRPLASGAFGPSASSAPQTNLPPDGEAVCIEGQAQNAFSGAIVMTDKGVAYYVEGLEEWPANLLGSRVRVDGTRQHKDLAPDPLVDKDGAVSHGMQGDALVLEGATWTSV